MNDSPQQTSRIKNFWRMLGQPYQHEQLAQDSAYKMVFWGSVSVGKHVFGPSMESMMDQEKIHVYTLTMLTFAILDAVLFCLLRMTASSPPGQRNTPGSWAMAHMIMLFSHISYGSAVFALAYTVALLVGWYTLILTPVLGVAMNDLLGKNQNQQVHQKPPAPASYTPGKSSNDMRSPTGSLRSRGGGGTREEEGSVYSPISTTNISRVESG